MRLRTQTVFPPMCFFTVFIVRSRFAHVLVFFRHDVETGSLQFSAPETRSLRANMRET